METEALREAERLIKAILNGNKHKLYVINTDGTISEIKKDFTLLSIRK